MNNFSVPGEKGFGLGGFFAQPKDRSESGMFFSIWMLYAELFRNYYRQLREETAKRVLERVYDSEGIANKFWLAFGKKKFMNILTA